MGEPFNLGINLRYGNFRKQNADECVIFLSHKEYGLKNNESHEIFVENNKLF